MRNGVEQGPKDRGIYENLGTFEDSHIKLKYMDH